MGFEQNTAEHRSAIWDSDLAVRRTLFLFGVFELDIESRELRKQGVKIRLQEQPFQILQVLLEQPGKVVTREELKQRIWPSDTFVDFDRGLYNAIKKLREALGDSAESPRFIETLSRRGYRFIAAVNGNATAAATGVALPAAARIATKRSLRVGLVLAAGVTILLGAALGAGKFWQRFSRGSAAPEIHSIAVLPLQNLSADPAQEYFSDGMTDALITDLAQISSLKVISRTSSMQYKETKKSLPEIARELNVDGIVEGTVQRSGDRVRITAQLIHGPADKHLWANSYEENMNDVFALERSVAEDIAIQVRARFSKSSQPQAAGPRRVNPDVLEAYLRGNYYAYKADHGGGNEVGSKAREYFQQAIDTDPQFAPAYIGMANAHIGLPQGSNEDWEIAEASAKKAIELDPDSADAHSTLGEIRLHRFWDWITAEKEIRTSVSLSPNSAESHGSLCGLLDSLARLDEALKECETAQELDPNRDHMFDALYFRGECDRYIPLLRRWTDLDPDFMVDHSELAHCYWMKGMYKESIQEMERTIVLVGLPKLASRVHQAFVTSGYKGAARVAAEGTEQLASSKQGFYPTLAADLYAQLGNKDRAFYWLEQAYEHPELVSADNGLMSLKVDPMLEPLRSDPRYKDLLRRVGLPP